MSINPPPTMRSFVAPRPCKPSEYEVIDVPTPSIKRPDEVLIRMHAAGLQTGDTQNIQIAKVMGVKPTYPLRLGKEGSGIVVAVGSGVAAFKPGDAVYGFHWKRGTNPILDTQGFCSQYTVTEERFLLPKPSHIAFENVAGMVGISTTMHQCFQRGMQLMGGLSDLEGKTVFIPGALSSSGVIACQMAKNVYGARKVISTVSTTKMQQGLVESYIPGIVDELLDYQAEDVAKKIGRTVDFALNTQWGSLDTCFKVVHRDRGVVMSISSIPSASTMKSVLGDPFPIWLLWLLDLAQLWYKWKLAGTGIQHEMLSGNPGIREDLERVGEMVATGKIKAITELVDLKDAKGLSKAIEGVSKGKGRVGKLVVKIA